MKAPLFELPFIDSKEHYKLVDDKGKNIILTFWASWCPDCSTDLPKKEQLFKTIQHNNVKMLTINVTGREREEKDGINFSKKFLSQPTLADRGREVYDLYQCQGVPTTVLIDQEGNIFKKFDDQAAFSDILVGIGALLEKDSKS